MEILQTIWNVLTTENERLANILICFFSFIESYLYMLVFTTILKIKTTRKKEIIYTITFAIIAVINILFIPYPFYTFINVLACPILVLIIFKLNIFTSILCEIVLYFVSMIVATPLILIYTNISNLSAMSVTSIPIHRITYSLFFYVSLFVFYKLCIKFNIKISKTEKLKTRFSTNLIINFILGTLAIALQFYIEFTFIDYIPIYLIILSTLIFLIYFVISLYSLSRTNKLEITKQTLEEEKLYNQTLTLLYDNIRGFKHDFNNIVQGIGGYISTNNVDGLKEYYSQILDDCQRVNNLSLLSPEVINNPAIYSLLTAKYHTATEFGIKINLEIFMDLSNIINIKIYELTRILGILIDNAIEAAKQCEEKEITITFRKDSKTRKQLFIIENTYTNKDVDISTIFEKGKTSKKDEDSKNHGLGLWEIRQILKKNKNLDLYTTKNDKYFKQQFEIYY